MREGTLLLHFIGFGLLMTSLVSGFIINGQYKRAKDIQTKATILRAFKPVSLTSPVGMLLVLITGIGNMHALGVGLLTLGWLTAKIIFFAIAVIGGIIMSISARKRGALVAAMAAGTAPPDAEAKLAAVQRQIGLSYVVMPILMLSILFLSVIGRLGAQ